MNQDGVYVYQSLAEQYRHLGLPTELLAGNTDFTIFNLAELHQPLPFKSPVSRLNFYVFCFIKQGKGHYVIDDQQFEMHPGTVYFTNPGHYRCFNYDAIGEVYLITLSESFLQEHVHANVFAEFPFLLAETLPAVTLQPELFAEFERIYLLLHQEYLSSSPLRLRLLGQLFGVLLLKFKEHLWLDYDALQEGTRSSQIVRNFKTTLEKHYQDLGRGAAEQVFRVQDYADALYLHPNYLNTVITSKTGKTIGTWIADKNIAEAKLLLQNSALAVKEIAYRLGFTEPSHFSAYFKKHTQLSPVLYRRRH